MTYVGKTYLVKLPQHVADMYNRDNPAIAPVDAGTQRPVLVVGELLGQVQQVDSGKTNPDGTHIMKDVSLPDTVSVLIYHDGPITPHYVSGVPVEALLDVDSNPETEPSTGDNASSTEDGSVNTGQSTENTPKEDGPQPPPAKAGGSWF